jgi:ATP-dependent Clp endopeptidase proteolytic subunit ClpP
MNIMSDSTKTVQQSPTILVNHFDEDSVKRFKEEFFRLMDDEFIPIVAIYVDSYGGEIHSLLAMVDIMTSRTEKPVATIALGKAMSCGGILLACGSDGLRFAGPNSTIMIHEVSAMNWGTLADLKNNLKEVERLNTVVFKILETKCKQKSGYFQNLIKNNKQQDLYFTANQSKKHRIIDVIGMPKIEFGTAFHISWLK